VIREQWTAQKALGALQTELGAGAAR
jgi:hypothetical protein